MSVCDWCFVDIYLYILYTPAFYILSSPVYPLPLYWEQWKKKPIKDDSDSDYFVKTVFNTCGEKKDERYDLLVGSKGSLFLRNNLLVLSMGFVLWLSKPPRSVSPSTEAKSDSFSLKRIYSALSHQRQGINQGPLRDKVSWCSSTYSRMNS